MKRILCGTFIVALTVAIFASCYAPGVESKSGMISVVSLDAENDSTATEDLDSNVGTASEESNCETSSSVSEETNSFTDTSSEESARIPEKLPIVYIQGTSQYGMEHFWEKFNTQEELVDFILSGESILEAGRYAETVFRNDGYILVPENSEYATVEENGYAIRPIATIQDIGIVHKFDNPFIDFGESDSEQCILVCIARLAAEDSNFIDFEGEPYPTSLDGMTMSEYLITRRRLDYLPEDEVYDINNPIFIGQVYRAIGPWYSYYYVAIDDTHYLYLEAYQTDVKDILAFLESMTLEKVSLFEE